MTTADVLDGVLLGLHVVAIGLFLMAAGLGLALPLTMWAEAWQQRREAQARAQQEIERIHAEANDNITRLETAFWEARQQLRAASDREH